MKRNISITGLRMVVVSSIQLLQTVVLARELGVSSTGYFNTIQTVAYLIAIAMSAGMPASIVYFINNALVSKASLIRLIKIHITIVAVLCTLAITCTTFFKLKCAVDVVLITSVAFFQFTYLIAESWLQAEQDFKSLNYLSIANSVVMLLLISFSVWFLKSPKASLLSLAVSSGAMSIFVLLMKVRKETLSVEYSSLSKEETKLVYDYGLKIYINSMMAYISHRVDLLLVNYFLGNSASGIYAVAVQSAERLGIISQAFATVIYPKLCGKFDRREQIKYAFKAALSIQAIVAPSVLIIFFLSDNVFYLLFGESFGDSILLFKIISFGVLVASSARMLFIALSSSGNIDKNLRIGMVTVVYNVIASIFLIKYLGLIGSALASITTQIVAIVLVTMALISILKK